MFVFVCVYVYFFVFACVFVCLYAYKLKKNIIFSFIFSPSICHILLHFRNSF